MAGERGRSVVVPDACVPGEGVGARAGGVARGGEERGRGWRRGEAAGAAQELAEEKRSGQGRMGHSGVGGGGTRRDMRREELESGSWRLVRRFRVVLEFGRVSLLSSSRDLVYFAEPAPIHVRCSRPIKDCVCWNPRYPAWQHSGVCSLLQGRARCVNPAACVVDPSRATQARLGKLISQTEGAFRIGPGTALRFPCLSGTGRACHSVSAVRAALVAVQGPPSGAVTD